MSVGVSAKCDKAELLKSSLLALHTRCAALVPRHHLYGIRGTSTGGSGIVTLLVLGIVIRRVLSKCRATLKTVTAGQGKISVVLV